MTWRQPIIVLVAGFAVTVLVARPVMPATASVNIADFKFSPEFTEAQMVANEPGYPAPHAHARWFNGQAGTDHTVTFDDPAVLSSGILATGQLHEAVIYKTGTFGYRCTVHPEMRATLVVTPPPPAPDASAPGESPGRSGIGSWISAALIVLGAGVVGLAVVRAYRRTRTTDHRGTGSGGRRRAGRSQ